ncbi:DUF4105 domain-containing protein [Pseudoxanthomonas sp. SGT-18]|uniref:lipoprotein N-acyltransferase Lnb domain-containing protein n=1 Tax=Pseudoxanthomonas sp. SGT-18 TaxID=2493087 RepID=UPI000F62B961|nr:DUF4105 domain-containing protein [Pseudoxanthomonas sp. SGT-18]
MPARAWAALLLAGLLALLAPVAAAAPRIGVLTMQPGEVFFERFGHDAIVVADPASGEAVSYNFGYFDPTEPDFVARFVRGEMMYMLVALPLEQDLEQYRQSGRGVTLQWLDLEPEQARALAASLAERARPENARYRYDYFTANCATQVRDALDQALGGALRSQLAGRSRGNTYRSEAVRLARPAPWMWLGFDLGLGPYADRPLSRWEEAFVPMRLADSLREARRADGRPLVLSEHELLPHLIAPEPVERPRRVWPWLLAGLAGAVAILALRRRPRALAAFAAPLWLLCGIGGALMAFIWLGTAHEAGWANRNLFLLDPLCLLLLPGAFALLRGRVPGRLFRALPWGVAAIACLGWVLQWLSLQAQSNQPWIALLLPLHLALALALGRRA